MPLPHKIETLQVKKCVEIASRCVAANRKERPSINYVLHELEQLEEEIKKMLPSEEPQGSNCTGTVIQIKYRWNCMTKITFR